VEETAKKEDRVSHEIIGAALDVHSALGPGLLESAYCSCLAYEFSKRGLRFEKEKSLPVVYKEVHLDTGYRLDFVVEDCVVVEVKSVDTLCMLHQAQVMSYLKLGGYKLGLLMNFNVTGLKSGIKRVVLNL
jgi:GxxExxY protein